MLVKAVSMMVSIFTLFNLITCSPYDDGKYNPKKYILFDDGKYYRPPDEGKYIPGDEGRYTYVYRQGLYPTDDGDYRYIHQVGPNGGFGGNGGNGGNGQGGSNGGNGLDGLDTERKPNAIEYIGYKTYAERFPYIHRVIKALIDKYVSSDILTPEGSSVHYSRMPFGKETADKCQCWSAPNQTEILSQFPPSNKIDEEAKPGSCYSFKGTKLIDTVPNSLTSKVKVEYKLFVRVTEVSD